MIFTILFLMFLIIYTISYKIAGLRNTHLSLGDYMKHYGLIGAATNKGINRVTSKGCR